EQDAERLLAERHVDDLGGLHLTAEALLLLEGAAVALHLAGVAAQAGLDEGDGFGPGQAGQGPRRAPRAPPPPRPRRAAAPGGEGGGGRSGPTARHRGRHSSRRRMADPPGPRRGTAFAAGADGAALPPGSALSV